MLGKIRRISHPGQLVAYLLKKEDAKVLSGESHLAATRAEGAELVQAVKAEIDLNKELRPGVEKVAAHAVVSLPPGEALSDEAWNKVARETLARLGYEDVPFAVIRHTDTDKQHIHILAGTITRKNGRVPDHFEGRRIVKVMGELREELGLRHEKLDGETVPPPRPEAPLAASGTDRADVIRREIERSRSLAELVRRLHEAGVATSWNISPSTSRVSGVSYELGGEWHKGRSLGKDLAWGALEKRFGRPGIADVRQVLEANRIAGKGTVRSVRTATEEDAREWKEIGELGVVRAGERVDLIPAMGSDAFVPTVKPRPPIGTDLAPLKTQIGIAIHESDDLQRFLDRVKDELDLRARFLFRRDRPYGLAFVTSEGLWYAGSELDCPWRRLRQRFKPTLRDLPVLLRANELAGEGPMEIHEVLGTAHLPGRSRANAMLLIADSEKVRLEPIYERVDPESPYESADWHHERPRLRRVLRDYLERARLDLSNLAEHEHLVRLSTYADARMAPQLKHYRSRRAALREWRSALESGERTDLREYLRSFERFQRVRALRLHRHGVFLHQRVAARLARIDPEKKPVEWLRGRALAHRIAAVVRHYAPPAFLRRAAELATRTAARAVFLAKAALIYAPGHLAQMSAEWTAESFAMKAFELPETARHTYRFLCGRFVSVTISAAIKAIQADDGEAAGAVLAAKASNIAVRKAVKLRRLL